MTLNALIERQKQHVFKIQLLENSVMQVRQWRKHKATVFYAYVPALVLTHAERAVEPILVWCLTVEVVRKPLWHART